MTAAERARLGRAWVEMGLAEHASVAAFARFVLHLMSLGAPPDLLREAIRAMGDEVEHARTCFTIARQFTGQPASPGRLDVRNVMEGGNDAASILLAAIREGCLEETLSAHCVEVAAEGAVDPAIRAALAQIADDEARHADLSWRFVAWVLEQYPELLASAEKCFSLALHAPRPAAVDDDTLIEGHGHLRASSRRRIEEATLREVVGPRADALFGRHVRRHDRAPNVSHSLL